MKSGTIFTSENIQSLPLSNVSNLQNSKREFLLLKQANKIFFCFKDTTDEDSKQLLGIALNQVSLFTFYKAIHFILDKLPTKTPGRD